MWMWKAIVFFLSLPFAILFLIVPIGDWLNRNYIHERWIAMAIPVAFMAYVYKKALGSGK